MAATKAKRNIHLSQPNHLAQPQRLPIHSEPQPEAHPQTRELMPVKVHVYRTLAELNAGFEKVLQDLQTLGHVSFLRSGSVSAVHAQIARIRSQINGELITTLRDREATNAGYFERLCGET